MKRSFICAVVLGSLIGLTIPRAAAAPGAGTDPEISVGTGEKVLLVVGGEYLTQWDAEAAGNANSFGDLQGFYVAQTGWFEGLVPGKWLLASAFRTTAGAAEFEELARAAGVSSLRRLVVRYLGTADIGLGQEPAPDGSGPLLEPLPDGHPDKL